MIIDLRVRDGVWWPAEDTYCREAIANEIEAVAKVVASCAQHRTAVQAGANVGIYPRALKASFDRVITFEPDIPNALCAELNLRGTGVELWLAALGEKPGRTATEFAQGPTNTGAIETRPGGMIPVMTVDSLGLADCDLIWLDIEGDEWPALKGAARTIEHCRPLIVCEDKGLAIRHGTRIGELQNLLGHEQNYLMQGKLGNDIVMVPAERLRKAA